MKAVYNGKVIAEADAERIITIEGNSYFPPDSKVTQYFEPTTKSTFCPWKGEASYYDVVVDGERNEAAAWYYPVPKEGAIDKVGADFSAYVAFGSGIEVTS